MGWVIVLEKLYLLSSQTAKFGTILWASEQF